MPLAKIHFVEGRYDEARIGKVSGAIQAALMNTLRVPPEDFYQLIFELPKNRFLHTPSFVGMHYTDDLIILDVTFIQGRPKETRLALFKDIPRALQRPLTCYLTTCSSRSTKLPARTSLSANARRNAPTRSPALEARASKKTL